MPNDVKTAERRTLHFETLEEILADAEAVTAVPHRTTGNWSAAQIIHHVTVLLEVMTQGKDLPMPLPIKIVGRGLRLFGVHRKTMKPGIKPPAKTAAKFSAPPDTDLNDALAYMREEVRIAGEQGMKYPSPLFGKLSHSDAVAMHCRHAELHLSFILPA